MHQDVRSQLVAMSEHWMRAVRPLGAFNLAANDGLHIEQSVDRTGPDRTIARLETTHTVSGGLDAMTVALLCRSAPQHFSCRRRGTLNAVSIQLDQHSHTFLNT